MYKYSLAKENKLSSTDKYTFFHFYDEKDGKYIPLSNSPLCGLTLRNAQSMRFRWNETNDIRTSLLNEIALNLDNYDKKEDISLLYKKSTTITKTIKQFIPVQLFHTKDVYKVDNLSDTKDKIGDGIITTNSSLIPTITVADCVPIYLFDKTTGAFGVVHSGWKGTGIAIEAIKLFMKEYGTKKEDVYVVIGPHIDECCYIVNEERAQYFSNNFTPLCVTPVKEGEKVPGNWDSGSGQLYHLSLSVANIESLKSFGVLDSHITLCKDCTCCNSVYGSNRRETSLSGKPNEFTVMAAFIAKRS